jgi:hypothetical protein
VHLPYVAVGKIGQWPPELFARLLAGSALQRWRAIVEELTTRLRHHMALTQDH